MPAILHNVPPPTPADWLRQNEGALHRRDEQTTGAQIRLTTNRGAAPVLVPGLFNLAVGGRWLYPSPASYCAIQGSVEEAVEGLEKKVFYLGPVTRNKVVRALQLVRGAVGEEKELLLDNVAVALIVADLQMDCDTVCAALLRSVVGRPGCEEELVEREVGGEVLRILEFHAQVERSVGLCVADSFTEMSFSNLRELILVGAMDEQRAISLELAKAVLEIRTLDKISDEHEKRNVARRTMYLYAPLANQMGMWFVQGELEELAFMHLEPQSFYMVRHLVGERRRECESTLSKSKEFLERMLSTTPEVRNLVRMVLIKGRVKGLYSVYRKMRRSGKKVHEIYDLLALRVVIQPKKADEASEIAACYAVADAIKQHYETFESRAKDYIASPKRNGYRSLHLTVVPRGGSTPLEIQIRTQKMHHVAEFGAAAHWIYKEHSASEEALGGEETNSLSQGHDRPSSEHVVNNMEDTTNAIIGEDLTLNPNAIIRADDTFLPVKTATHLLHPHAPVEGGSKADMEQLTSGLASTRRLRSRDDELQRQLRKGYVTCLGSAIRTSRVIVAAAGQLYGLDVGSTLMDLARGLGVASLGAIAVVNGSVAPLTQRLEMADIVRFISEAG